MIDPAAAASLREHLRNVEALLTSPVSTFSDDGQRRAFADILRFGREILSEDERERRSAVFGPTGQLSAGPATPTAEQLRAAAARIPAAPVRSSSPAVAATFATADATPTPRMPPERRRELLGHTFEGRRVLAEEDRKNAGKDATFSVATGKKLTPREVELLGYTMTGRAILREQGLTPSA